MSTVIAARTIEGTAEIPFPYEINGHHAADFTVAVDYRVYLGRPGEGAEVQKLGDIRLVCLAEPPRFERDGEGRIIRLPDGRLLSHPAVYVWEKPGPELLEKIEAWLASRDGQAAVIEAAENLAADIG